MDRSWMKLMNRRLQECLDGVQQFLNFASNHAHLDGMILCPYKKMCACRFVAYRCCIGSLSVTWDL